MAKLFDSASFFVLLFLQFATRSPVSAECNSCFAENNLACVSKTQFQVCVNGYPNGPVNTCPTGYVCSTANTTICQPNVEGVLGDCNECEKCDSTNTFACTGLRTFALCLGTGTITDITGTCEPSYICSIDYPYICGNATMGISPTCSSSGNAWPTQSPPVDNPVAFCQAIQQRGRFPVGNDPDTTCRQYVNCFLNGGTWHGSLYNCPGYTYFDSNSRYCTPQIPANCNSTTQSLFLRSSMLRMSDDFAL